MAESIQAMRERRNALAKEARNLHENTPAASWDEKAQAQYDEKLDEIGRVDAAIKRENDILALDAARQAREMGIEVTDQPKNALLNKWLRGGDNALSAQEWQSVRNTMSVGTNSEGGYTVQTDVAAELIKGMKAYGGMRSVATVFHTSQGNPMNWPTCDDTSNTGELVAENAAAASQDAAFSTVGLNVYKFSSKVVTVPFELLQDSQINIDALVVDLLAERLGRVQNTYFTTGTGSSQPKGIVTAAASGKTGTTGQTSTVIYDDLVDLIHSIDPAYRQGGKLSWMMNDASVKVIRKIKDGQSRPIFVPGYETGVPGGAPDTLLGYDIVINQDVATMAANAKSILFGRLGNYRIRDVMSATLFRFTDSAYTKNGQVGFLAWMRAGGNLIDLSGATVKYYANSAT
jgi:HK97 family phage major capsid protein